MAKFGYSLSAEQLTVDETVKLAHDVEKMEFEFAMISDHFHPWTESEGQSAFVWSMLGALSQVTDSLEIGTGVTALLLRYHPAIIAQAAATVATLMEGRFVFGVGAGENLNEHIVGEGWPPVTIRHEMFAEAIDIIKTLWRGEKSNYYGNYYTIEDAKIYTLPDKLPPIIISAYGPKAAKIAGEMGDGLITTSPNAEVVKTFQDNGGKGKPMYIQFTVSFDEDEEKAIQTAYDIWPIAGYNDPLNTELRLPKYFEKAKKMISPGDIAEQIPYGPDPQKYIDKITEALDLGFTHIYLNQIGHEQTKFMKFYKEQVITKL
jgi:G6PDH family F420-dependent oxidoreductase